MYKNKKEINRIKYCFLFITILVMFLNCKKDITEPDKTNNKLTDSLAVLVRDSIKYDSLVRKFINSKEFSASVLIAEHSRIKFCKSYGMANYQKKIPNNPDTRYYISSMTKPITATAIMQLAEKGLINIMDSVIKYLPECAELKDITIFHLLTHSSGLARNFSYDIVSPTSEKISQALNGISLNFAPGSAYSYSSIGYYILGMIIEKVTGQTYNSYVIEHIFKPLDMRYSGCGGNAQTLEEFATGYSYYSGSLVQENMDMGILFSAGNIYSNVKDLYLFDRALYNQRLLSNKTVNEMYAPLFNTDVENRSMGIGWFVTKVGNETFIEHGGLSNGYNSLISRRVSDESVIIILSNISNPQVGTKELIRFLYSNML